MLSARRPARARPCLRRCLSLALLGFALLLIVPALPGGAWLGRGASAAPPAPPPPPPPAIDREGRIVRVRGSAARVVGARPGRRRRVPPGLVLRSPPQPPPPAVDPAARPDLPVAAPVPAGPLPSAPAPPANPGPRDPNAPPPIIRRIEFEGTLVYSPASIKVLLRNKEGKRLDEVALDADMVTLFQYFKEVELRQEDVPGGVVLHIRVSENPLVVELNVRGHAAVDEKEIRDVMRTRVGFPLNPYHLSEDAQDIVAMYRLRGYHFAHVPEPLITTLLNGGRRVDLAIVEGPEVEVDRVVFRGNVTLPDKKLKAVMLTKAPTGMQAIFGGVPFREDALIEDIVAIKEAYRDEGFLDAEVFLDDLRFSDDKSKAVITIAVEEHLPYRLGRLKIEIERYEENPAIGATPDDARFFTRERIRGWIPMQEGGRFAGSKLKKGLERIRSEYFKRSFLEASVSVPGQFGRQTELVVDLEIKVTEGPKLRIARIDFVGNEYTRDKILRREVQLSPGGYVDRGELERGESRLKRTGWFDRATMRMQDAVGPDGKPLVGWKSVAYEIVEGKTGNFNFGVGLSTNGGAFGTLQFTKRNFDIARLPHSFDELISRRAFTGAGQELDIFLQPSTVESAFRIRFREPRMFGSKVSFEASVSKTFSFREDFLVDRGGYSLALGYPLYESKDDTLGISAALRWRHEYIDLRELEPDAVPGAFIFAGSNELRSLSLSVRLRAVDDPGKRTSEFTANAAAELVGAALGGDVDFYKLTAGLSYMRVLSEDDEGKKQRFTGRVTLGYGEALEDTSELPPFERFFLGGSSFRGFAFRGLGPHAFGSPEGGEWLVSGTLEYEYPLIAKTISIVAFTDWGTLATNIRAADANQWRLSVGLGLRIVVPMLGSRPLAFDFGFPIFSEQDDEKTVVSFNLGRNF